ncbi:MAG: hypothetical protein MI757_12860 [Pirellulales bacterium]|nr:hypothetical protein [Pirellulales bacterium]
MTVVEEQGEYAKVRFDGGREIFVPISVLQTKSSLDEGDHSHTLSAPVHARTEPPAGPVELPQQTKRDLLVEQMSLNRVFLTEKTKKVVIAPGNTQPTFEGEKCWAAYVCTNPQCPAKDQGKDGLPFLFINTSDQRGALCPACKPLWEPYKDDPDVAAHYRTFAKQYVPPESARRQKEIDAIRKRAAAERRAKYARRKAKAKQSADE